MTVAAHLYAVSCPTCHAPINEPCTSQTSGRRAGVVHVARQNRALGRTPDGHNHDLDGLLHEHCEMCAEITRRQKQARHDSKALGALDHTVAAIDQQTHRGARR